MQESDVFLHHCKIWYLVNHDCIGYIIAAVTFGYHTATHLRATKNLFKLSYYYYALATKFCIWLRDCSTLLFVTRNDLLTNLRIWVVSVVKSESGCGVGSERHRVGVRAATATLQNKVPNLKIALNERLDSTFAWWHSFLSLMGYYFDCLYVSMSTPSMYSSARADRPLPDDHFRLMTYLNLTKRKNELITVSQCSPVNPKSHLHLYPFTSSMHVP